MGSNFVSVGGVVLAVQVAGALIAPLALLFAPPATGAILLISIGRTSAVRFARDHGADVLGPGPIAGSVVVMGDRARLMLNPLTSGIVAIAAAPAGCGTTRVIVR